MSNEIKTVSVIGIGFMGKLIAGRTAVYDYNVRIYDINPEGLDKLARSLDRKKKRKKVFGEVTSHDSIAEAVVDADLIIEAGPEKLELKKEVFSEIDKAALPNAVIATNSSSIPVSKIEEAVQRKDKVLNIHFYPPIPTRPMADLMRGSKTSEETFNTCKRWIESIGCHPIELKKEIHGFVFNRMWHAARREALKLWAGGYADIETIDLAWKTFTGMKMGPFVLMDGIGLDTVYAVQMSYYYESNDPRDKPPDKLKEMIDHGNLGMKSGKGFYTWAKKKKELICF